MRVDGDRNEIEALARGSHYEFLQTLVSGAHRRADRRAGREDGLNRNGLALDEIGKKVHALAPLVQQFDVGNRHRFEVRLRRRGRRAGRVMMFVLLGDSADDQQRRVQRYVQRHDEQQFHGSFFPSEAATAKRHSGDLE